MGELSALYQKKTNKKPHIFNLWWYDNMHLINVFSPNSVLNRV